MTEHYNDQRHTDAEVREAEQRERDFEGSLDKMPSWVTDLARQADEPLHPDLVPYYDDGTSDDGTRFPMVRHPLVYDLLPVFGRTNRAYEAKKASLARAIEEEDWHTVVFLHERPYRLKALIEYVTGSDEDDQPILLECSATQEVIDLVADVWVDSENIEQCIEDWRALIGDADGLFLGTAAESAAFYSLPWSPADSTIIAWRGGTVGDWSWTVDPEVARRFAARSGHAPRKTRVHMGECFGYLTRRGESELLVRLTDERKPLVYPQGF